MRWNLGIMQQHYSARNDPNGPFGPILRDGRERMITIEKDEIEIVRNLRDSVMAETSKKDHFSRARSAADFSFCDHFSPADAQPPRKERIDREKCRVRRDLFRNERRGRALENSYFKSLAPTPSEPSNRLSFARRSLSCSCIQP